MSARALSPEIISLVHHTELNRAGWWDRSLQQLVLAAIWLEGRPLSEPRIAESLRGAFHLEVDAQRISSIRSQMEKAGSLVELPGGDYSLSEPARAEIEACVRDAERVAKGAKDRFCEVLSSCCPSLDGDREWRSFQDDLLIPLVREIGARTYQLISGSGPDLETTGKFAEYLSRYAAEHRQGLRSAIVTYLDPLDADVRAYVLRCLNAYFCVEAGNLGETTVEALARAVQRPPSFKVFVDTNFLFSFLELHQNPSNEAAKALVALTRKLAGKAHCQFYVSSETLDEFKRVVSANAGFLRGLSLPRNLADAALHFDLSGVARRFVEFQVAAGRPVSAEDYFGPYLVDLKPILRSRSMEFFNDPMTGYGTRQDVVDDILGQQRFENKRYPGRPKSYEQLRHDVVLWHFVADKRPTRVESPVEATYWIVTVDYHFLGYDLFKGGRSGSHVPVCLHPTSLMQMLQLWLPRTQEFEEAILGSLRLPFLFQEFDPAAERVTVRILDTLARFENVDQLSEKVVSNVLVNEALRQRLPAASDVQESIELVKSALIEETEKARSQADALSEEMGRLRAAMKDRDREIGALRDELRNRSVSAPDQAAPAALMPQPLPDAPVDADVPHESWATHGLAYFTISWLFLLALLMVAAYFGLRQVLPPKVDFARSARTIWGLEVLLWVWLVDHFGQRHPAIKRHRLLGRLHDFRIWIFSTLAFVVAWWAGQLFWSSILGLSALFARRF